MAIAFVQDTSSGTDTVTVPAAGFAAGNLLVAGGFWDSTDTISGITDTGGNSWASAVENAGNGHRAVLWYSLITNALTSGQTIVANVPSNDGIWIVAEFSGIATSPLDQTQNTSDINSMTHTTGTTAATAQADELLVGVQGCVSATADYVATGGFTENEQIQFFGSINVQMQYQIVSATGTYESTSTSVTGLSSNNLIATFKGAVVVVDTGLAWIRA